MAKKKSSIATTALGGAATGAAIGSVIPGVGTAIGAGVGAGAGALLGLGAGLTDYFMKGPAYSKPEEIQALQAKAAERRAEREKNRQLALAGIDEQLRAAEAAVGLTQQRGRVAEAQAAEEGAIARTRLAQPRGFGSGAAYAGSGQIAANIARAKRDIKAKTDAELLQAKAAAGEAKKRAATEREDIAKAEAAMGQAARAAVNEATRIFNDAIDDTFLIFDADDRKAAAKRIRDEVLAGETNELIIQQVEQYIADNVLNPEGDVSWRIG